MPSKSLAQARFMSAAYHDPAFAQKAGIPQSVAADFHMNDTGAYGHQPGNVADAFAPKRTKKAHKPVVNVGKKHDKPAGRY